MPNESTVRQALQAPITGPSRSYLSDYSFRFDAAAAPAPAALPASGMDWTAAQTLAELRRRGTRIDRTSRGLRVRHAHRVPPLAVAVARHERVVGLWLSHRSGRPPAGGWDEETAALLRWLRSIPAPAEAVEVSPGVRVTDWDRFVASAEGRFREGADAPGAPSLRRDLAAVFQAHQPAGVRPLRVARTARAA